VLEFDGTRFSGFMHRWKSRTLQYAAKFYATLRRLVRDRTVLVSFSPEEQMHVEYSKPVKSTSGNVLWIVAVGAACQ